MDNTVKKYLFDILECINFIDELITEIPGFHAYQKHKLYKPAIERKIEIIGEAVNKADKLFPELNLTKKKKIISMRNRIIHAYDAVDDVLIWEVIKKHLPVLKKEVEQLLQN